jgi:hypothetical protein
VTPASSVQLDPDDAEDRKIIARQVKAARQAGRDGRDRAGSTRGRVDLQQAFDEGASEAEAAVSAPAATPAAAPGPGGRPASPAPAGKSGGSGAWDRYRRMGPGWDSVKPTSPARLPTRVQDAGGFLTGLALYTVVIIYVRYGPEGWKGWLKAKFLNQPMDVAEMSSTKAKPSTGKGSQLV